jgi:nitrogenase subunit NifH
MVTHYEEMASYHAEELVNAVQKLSERDTQKAAEVLANIANEIMRRSMQLTMIA